MEDMGLAALLGAAESLDIATKEHILKKVFASMGLAEGEALMCLDLMRKYQKDIVEARQRAMDLLPIGVQRQFLMASAMSTSAIGDFMTKNVMERFPDLKMAMTNFDFASLLQHADFASSGVDAAERSS